MCIPSVSITIGSLQCENLSLGHGSKSEDCSCDTILKKLLELYFSSNFPDFFPLDWKKAEFSENPYFTRGVFMRKCLKIEK